MTRKLTQKESREILREYGEATATKKTWGVWCIVSGGVTGFREAWLKSDGKI